jgi:hypothetical protein
MPAAVKEKQPPEINGGTDMMTLPVPDFQPVMGRKSD